ncbi:MAG: aminotransferase class I/II-fold pyridoxal phosphate-dependent enzyme [Colwellia sp.]|jgi:Predicted pyridoxal phosphate-dependent enzyme apparently involved in regulation of cell wall biogenesis
MNSNLIVYCEDTIKVALEKINENCKGAVVVVNETKQLLRLLTDGDIRRAILNDINPAVDLVNSFSMSRNAISINKGVAYQDALKLIDDKDVDHVVVVDSLNNVVDLLHRKDLSKVWLSSPHLGLDELKYVNEAFATNWIAPLGPNVDGFEKEICDYTGSKHAVALSSGTAAIHLSLVLLDVKPDDVVFCSSLTFVASVNPVMYQGAKPVFIDSEPDSWNMSPSALETALLKYSDMGKKPKAIIVVNLYGQSADMDLLMALSKKYDVPIVEDAAESLGATYKGKSSGTFGKFGVFSFNGNKIITTSGGGMLISDDKELIEKARFLATQARDPAPYYEHTQVGYNYRMSNVLAGIGRGQLSVLSERVEARRDIFSEYKRELKDIAPLEWMANLEGYESNRWLTAGIINPEKTDITPRDLIAALTLLNIEARHVWKPMHLQPLFKDCDYYMHEDKLDISSYLFQNGICFPSGSNLTKMEQERIIGAIKSIFMRDKMRL